MEPGIISEAGAACTAAPFSKAPTGSALYYAMRTERWLSEKNRSTVTGYYFKDWGGMHQNAFIKNGTSVCHAAADGKLTVGWLQQGSTYYYFDETGEHVF